jgi:phenylpyruvate tautomerase
MPMIRVQLSFTLDQEKQSALMRDLSQSVAKQLGKPESYMMVVLESASILMGGKPEAAAFFEVRSVGTVSKDQAVSLSKAVGEILSRTTGVHNDRIYSNFAGVPGAMWGFDGGTFG